MVQYDKSFPDDVKAVRELITGVALLQQPLTHECMATWPGPQYSLMGVTQMCGSVGLSPRPPLDHLALAAQRQTP